MQYFTKDKPSNLETLREMFNTKTDAEYLVVCNIVDNTELFSVYRAGKWDFIGTFEDTLNNYK